MIQDLKINLDTKAITILIDKMTLIQLHRRLQDLSDDFALRRALTIYDPTPSIRTTDHIIELLDGWHVTNLERLSEGTLTQLGEPIIFTVPWSYNERNL